jgi:hypothetical protein
MSRVLGVVGAGAEAVRVMNTSLVWGRSFPVSRMIYLLWWVSLNFRGCPEADWLL